MYWKRVTKLVILLITGAAIVYDIVAFKEGTVDATISRIVLAWAHRWPIVPFAMGALVGHLTWPQPQEK